MLSRAIRHPVRIACALALVSGCGSTVSLSAPGTGEGAGGLTAPAPASSALPPAAAAAAPALPSGKLAAGQSISAARPGATGSGRMPAPTAPPVVSGVPAPSLKPGAPLKLGYAYESDITAAYAAAGAPTKAGQSSTNVVNDVHAVVKYINAHGGMAGHPIQPELYGYRVSNGTFASQMQAMCAHFTEDVHVYAVISTGNDADPLPQCLASHHTALYDDGNSTDYVQSQVAPALVPYYYRPELPRLDQLASQVTLLARWKWMTPADRIGVILIDDPQHRWTEQHVIAPAMQRLGLHVVTDYAYPFPSGFSDLSSTSAESNSAVLRFRQAGVDRVFYLASMGVLPFFFMPAAESQGYHPHYGFSSLDVPGFFSGTTPEDQLVGSEIVGSNRKFDLDWTGNHSTESPGGKRCADVLTQNGSTDPGLAGYMCDPFFFFKAVMDRAGTTNPRAVWTAMTKLVNLQTAQTFPMSFGAGWSDGIATVREAAFSTSCGCYRYVGKSFSVGS